MPVEGKYLKLNTEVYGGPIMYTWFDRPLSMAGRVMVKSDKPLKPATQFINFDRPLLEIPHIAIHFNRAVNDQGNPLSKQRDMLPVIAMINETFRKRQFPSEAYCSERIFRQKISWISTSPYMNMVKELYSD